METELVLDDSNILFKAQSSQDVFDALAETLSTIASWGEIYLWQNDYLELKTYFHKNKKKESILKNKIERFPINRNSPFGVAQVIRTGKLELIEIIPTTLLPQIFPNKDHLALMQSLGYSSTLALPLISNSEVLGAIQLVRESEKKTFLAEEVQQIQILLDKVSNVLQHFLRYEGLTTILRKEKRVKRLSQVSAYRYQQRINHFPLSTMILSHKGYTLAVNKAFNDFWGISIKDDVAYNVSLFEDPQLRKTGFLPIFKRALAGEHITGPPTFYDAGHTEGGKRRWFRHMISPIKRPDGRVREIIVVHVPLANEEQLEAMRRLTALGVSFPEAKQEAPDNPLSPRERSVLLLISEGCSNKEIAGVLRISSNTVKFHITSLFNKLGVNSRAQAVSTAVEKGFL